MKNKIIFGIIIALVAIVIICGVVYIDFNSSDEISDTMKEISIMVYDKDNKEVFNERINTDEQYSVCIKTLYDIYSQLQERYCIFY